MTAKRSRATRARANQRLREAEESYGPDRASVEFTFSDGWTIRRLTCLSDALREGHQMLSCLRDGIAENDVYPLESIYSLRDAENRPHLTIRHVERLGTVAYGKAETAPKPEYTPYVREWAAALRYGQHVYASETGPPEDCDNLDYLVCGYVLAVDEGFDYAYIDALRRAGRHDDAAILRSGVGDTDPDYLAGLLARDAGFHGVPSAELEAPCR